MDIIDLNIKVDQAFGNLYRKQCVLIAVKDESGKILTGAKPAFFPPGVTRLLGGGVDEGEDVMLAASRELEEELGVTISPERFTPLAQFNTSAVDTDGKEFYNETFLFGANIGSSTYRAGDDVKQIVALSTKEISALADVYENLPVSLWYRGEEGDFSWHDYGKLYSVIHKITVNKANEF